MVPKLAFLFASEAGLQPFECDVGILDRVHQDITGTPAKHFGDRIDPQAKQHASGGGAVAVRGYTGDVGGTGPAGIRRMGWVEVTWAKRAAGYYGDGGKSIAKKNLFGATRGKDHLQAAGLERFPVTPAAGFDFRESS